MGICETCSLRSKKISKLPTLSKHDQNRSIMQILSPQLLSLFASDSDIPPEIHRVLITIFLMSMISQADVRYYADTCICLPVMYKAEYFVRKSTARVRAVNNSLGIPKSINFKFLSYNQLLGTYIGFQYVISTNLEDL